jgi:polar amino acid transport system substrate-binding protein
MTVAYRSRGSGSGMPLWSAGSGSIIRSWRCFAAAGTVVLSLLMAPPAQAEEPSPLRLSCIDFPPYKIAPNEAGVEGVPLRPGMDVEIIQAAFAGSSLQPQFDFMPFKRAIELAARGDYAGICGCSRSAEREKTFLFSEPVNRVSLGLFAGSKEDLDGVGSVADLSGRQVIMVNGYVLEKELRAAGANLSLVPDDHQAAVMLDHRPHFILAGFRQPIEYHRERAGLTEPLFFRELSSGPNFLCLSRAYPDAERVMAVFNEGLKRINEDGSYAAILDAYRAKGTVPVN